MQECPKCRGMMVPGAAYVTYEGYRLPLQWTDGEPRKSLWRGLSFRGKATTDVLACRCARCGHIEAHLDPHAVAGKAGTEAMPEIEQLQHDVARLLARIAVLERIATDPAERTAREIESLRP